MRDLLSAVPGVRKVNVSFENELASVDYDASAVKVADMVAALKGGGYKSWSTATETKK